MASQTYATPNDDLASWRLAAPPPGQLSADLVAFLQCGTAPTLGVRDIDGRPLVGPGLACRVDADGLVRVIVPGRPNIPLLAAIEAGSAVAVTFSRARDHRSIQIKAPRAAVAAIRPDDACEAARQCAVLADDLIGLGYSPEQSRAIVAHDPGDLVAVELRPTRIFTQTPGPGAGTELAR